MQNDVAVGRTTDYYESDDFQAISLPYGTGRIKSMYIFLPTLPIFHQRLSDGSHC